MSLHLVADLEANRDRFVSRVRETKVVWGLRSEDGWAYCPSNTSERNVLLFWSDAAYAKRHAVEHWAEYVAAPINLDAFVDRWLRGMQEDWLLVGVNFNAELGGLECEPAELAQLLTSES